MGRDDAGRETGGTKPRGTPRKLAVDALDRMELKGVAFHRRVRQGYLAQANAQPDRYLVIDASPDVDAVTDALLRGLEARFGSG